MKLIKGIFFLSLILMASCSTVDYIKTSDDKTEKFEMTDISKIEIYSTKEISRPFLIMGQIISCSDAGDKADAPINLLKKKAAEIGADAVIDLRLEYAMGGWSIGMQAIGTAIKYKN